MDPDPRVQPMPEETHAPRPGEAHLPEADYRQPDPQAQPRGSSTDPGTEHRAANKKGTGYQGTIAAVVVALVASVGIYALIPHSTVVNTTPARQPSVAPTQRADTQGRITVSVDGVIYGTFNATQSALVLERFLKAGDQVVVTCVLLPQNSPSIVARVGTNICVYESSPLKAGQSQSWFVRAPHKEQDPGAAASAAAVQWFQQQAQDGNAVAQYGLANMYDAGLDGLPVDRAKAIALFQSAASQNFGDAADRAAELQQGSQQASKPSATTP
jgi:hypothetical protein